MATVLVTGAAGYLGSWVVAELLRQGHSVRGSVRSLHDVEKIAHLQALAAEFPQQLQLFAADLLSSGAFDEAAQGADVIMHTASPYIRKAQGDPVQEIITPAVEGTRHVLASASRSSSVRRVVLTSSIAAMTGSSAQTFALPGHQLVESCWNAQSTAISDPYSYSKTQAETLAWEMAKTQQQWDLVCINPGAIFGPSRSRRIDGESVQMVLQFLRGQFASGVPELVLGIVDVRDVAAAHVAAMQPAAQGRYLTVGTSSNLLQIGQAISHAFPGLTPKMPVRQLPKWLVWLVGPLVGLPRDFVSRNVGYGTRYDHARSVTELGLHYRPLGETLRDHVAQLQGDGLVG